MSENRTPLEQRLVDSGVAPDVARLAATVYAAATEIGAQKNIAALQDSGKLTAQLLGERLRSITFQHYSQWAAIIKSGVFVMAASSGHKLFFSPLSRVDWWRLMVLWFVSHGAIIVTYATWMGGSLFSTGKQNVGDHITVVAVGVIEYLLFLFIERSVENPGEWINS